MFMTVLSSLIQELFWKRRDIWGVLLVDSASMEEKIYTSHPSFCLEQVGKGKVCLRIPGYLSPLGNSAATEGEHPKGVVSTAWLHFTRTSSTRTCAVLDLTCVLIPWFRAINAILKDD